MIRVLKILAHWAFKGRWKAVPCGWPYRAGWATYCPRRHTILDTGLTQKEAIEFAKELNRTLQ